MLTFDEDLKEDLKDPEFKKEWDALESEDRIIRALVEARTEQHLTQKELALKSGVDQADISKIETGTRNPSLKILEKIADSLGMVVTLTPKTVNA